MPGGRYDSSKTRVKPVFDQLWERGRDWLPALLDLPTGGHKGATRQSRDLTLIERHWEPHEKCLNPPVSLLSWLIRNAKLLSSKPLDSDLRQSLAAGDSDVIERALDLLRSENVPRAWYIFEGPTCPDVLLVARDALVVIEGKRTEYSATVDTTWLKGRHQIWRHIDAAWEIRGNRDVYGFFIVESDPASNGGVPAQWREAAEASLDPGSLRTSFPHRSEEEIVSISSCFLGATTWRSVCERFDIDWRILPHEVVPASD